MGAELEKKQSANDGVGTSAARNHKETVKLLTTDASTLVVNSTQYLETQLPEIDKNKDGRISKSELQTEIDRITNAKNRSTLEGAVVPSLRGIAANFDAVAALDGKKDSLSVEDLKKLSEGMKLFDAESKKSPEAALATRKANAELLKAADIIYFRAHGENMKAVKGFQANEAAKKKTNKE